ncbi:NAD(P)/FAD-dependent oxidoreductase [Oceanicoccus sagamiensis]|uniref:FAD/NAD(P)-binding domain-containing protein n=1 Tax=Oceanicoccus sagamiensis TaxID=716816 RepID=A0A1X9NHR9_9GAMM|nr:FAD-dependent oxidoreductase [Oceanicoccus sagamiensis]ARN75059.1 hypothetical protein BST96_13610 [Oceanicoccus sagamiensis]
MKSSSPHKSVPRIIVIGAGAAGLPLVSTLGKALGKCASAEIILVDKNINHVWKPRLHEVASGALDEATDFINLPEHAEHYHYRFERGAVDRVDTEKRQITISEVNDESGNTTWPERKITYDHLVIAVGSRTNTWDIPDVDQHCFFLDGINHALSVRKRLTNIFLGAAKANRPTSIGIVGGGAAGVELCAEIARMAESISGTPLAKDPERKIQIHLIEGSEQLLPRLNQAYGEKFSSYMESLGIKLHLGFEVVKVTPDYILGYDGQTIPVDTMIWAGGILAPPWLAKIPGTATNAINQLTVDNRLRCNGVDRVYALGDCACVYDNGTEQLIPPRAQAAKQMADYLAQQLINSIHRTEDKSRFSYCDKGSLIAFSHYSSFGRVSSQLLGRTIAFEGAIAMLAYRWSYWQHHAAVRGYRAAIVHFLFKQLTKPKGLRLRLH